MKIEFDLPEFEKEININIIIRKDGEVVYSTSSPSPEGCTETGSIKVIEDKKPEVKNDIVDNILGTMASKFGTTVEPKGKATTGRRSSGNFMDMDF